jgi:hypothetical protein
MNHMQRTALFNRISDDEYASIRIVAGISLVGLSIACDLFENYRHRFLEMLVTAQPHPNLNPFQEGYNVRLAYSILGSDRVKVDGLIVAYALLQHRPAQPHHWDLKLELTTIRCVSPDEFDRIFRFFKEMHFIRRTCRKCNVMYATTCPRPNDSHLLPKMDDYIVAMLTVG